jgi:hypothetical protein
MNTLQMGISNDQSIRICGIDDWKNRELFMMNVSIDHE